MQNVAAALEQQMVRIRKKLVEAKNKDVNLEVFGSEKHKYNLNSPLSIEEIELFEDENHIKIPLEYRAFLLTLGNGGAGPYYGIYGLNLHKKDKSLSEPCKLSPSLSNQDWQSLTSFQDDEGITDDEYDKACESLFQGMLPIGTQGCTYNMMLVVNGDHFGRVVYVDEEFQKPFFTYETNFLDWYERWLDEIIQGYSMHWFGMNMGGNDTELIRIFNESQIEKTKIDAIRGMYKLPSLLDASIPFLEDQCSNGPDSVKNFALGLLAKHRFSRAKPILIRFLACEDDAKRLTTLQYIHWYAGDHINEVRDSVKALLSNKAISAETFRFATYILEKCTPVDFSDFVAFFYSEDKEIRKQALYTVGKTKDKYKYLKDFIHCLEDDEPTVVHSAVQALVGVTDRALLPYYNKLLEKYKSNEYYIRNNVELQLKKFGSRTKGQEFQALKASKASVEVNKPGIVDKLLRGLGFRR